MLLAGSDGPAFFDAEVVDGENVGAAKAENQEHFDGPGADAADRDEAFDEFFVGEFFGLFESGDDAIEGFFREVLHGEDFCAGEAGFAKYRFAEFEHFLWRGSAAGGAEGFDAAVNRGGSFAGNGLIGDGFEEHFVRAFGAATVDAKLLAFPDQRSECWVLRRQRVHGGAQIKWRKFIFRGQPEAPMPKGK